MKLPSWLSWTFAGVGGAVLSRTFVRRRRRIRLEGARVLITGSRGLALAIARDLARRGALIALVARHEDELEAAADDLAPAEVHTIVADLTGAGEPERVVAAAAERLGGLDILINDAGTIQVGPLEQMTPADFDQALKIHFWAPLATMTAAAGHLERGAGRIVNITSIGGRVAVPHLAPYTASKFAAVGLSNSFRAELRDRGIRVTTVCPGLMRTGSHVNALFKGDARAEYGWFATALALPFISMSAERAARKIVEACRDGEPYLTVGWPARLLVLVDTLTPGLVAELMAAVARALPGPVAGGERSRSGWESRGAEPAPVAGRIDRVVVPLNQNRARTRGEAL
jgi:short-subunit dehydrogenase